MILKTKIDVCPMLSGTEVNTIQELLDLISTILNSLPTTDLAKINICDNKNEVIYTADKLVAVCKDLAALKNCVTEGE